MDSAEVPAVTRLFIGNLVPAISNAALEASLSKFGSIKELTRNTDRNFAHASLTPNSAKDVDKCLSVLNQTRWFGAVLRVEVATEHFKVRLEKEWTEEKERERKAKLAALAARRERSNCDGASAGNDGIKSGLPNKFSWKGKRITFYKSDDVKNKARANTTSNKGKTNVRRAESPHACADKDKSGNGTSREPKTNPVSTRTLSTPVAATLDLFGLCTEDTEPVASPDKGPVDGQMPAKRARNSNFAGSIADRAEMIAIENDPSRMNVPAEKELARSIFEKMFPSGGVLHLQKKCIEQAVARHRRSALYQSLLGGEHSLSKEVPGNDFREAWPRIGAEKDQGNRSIESHRRKGMYRLLVGA